MWRRLIYYLVTLYGVSKSEATGFTILIPLICVVIFTPVWLKYVVAPDTTLDNRYHEEFKEWLADVEASVQEPLIEGKENKPNNTIKFYDFDPNTASVEELTSLGFKPWIAERIVKYRKAGGRFDSDEDLNKIYGISQEHLDAIRPFIIINAPNPAERDKSFIAKNENEVVEIVKPKIEIRNINTAIAEDMVFVRGIGPVLSERIVKYRDMLGGFSSLDQIDEVYGLDNAIADSLKKYFYIDTLAVRKLDVNYLKAEELRKHPYINYKLANALVQYRIQHGNYTQPDDLLMIKILDDSTFQKILPYLKID